MSRCSDDMNLGSLTFESLEYAQANGERVRQSQPDISVIRTNFNFKAFLYCNYVRHA